MPIELNHTIVHARDPQASAAFLADLLGRGAPIRLGPFYGVELDNRVTLDFIQAGEELTIEHYAFLVSEEEFDQIFGRIQARDLSYWADPAHQQPAASTTTTAAAASTGTIRMVTTSRSSPAPTAVAGERTSGRA